MKRRFHIGKLIRDKTADMSKTEGGLYTTRILSDQEYDLELKKKIAEEAEEVSQCEDRETLIDELGDVLDVVGAIMAHHGISLSDVQACQKLKHQKRGGFSKKIYGEYVDIQEPGRLLNYVLSHPDKYPEIKL